MRIAYFDCFSGASGDMILGGLIDAGADVRAIQAAIVSMGLPELTLQCNDVQKNGFRANQLTVNHPPEHAHRHLSDIAAMVDKGEFSPRAKQLAMAIFRRIAVAEARVHGSSIDEVHFHEVGAVDSIADIVGVAIAWEQIGAEAAYASAVPLGDGQIIIAHGLVKVPAPATAEILRGIPIAPTNIAAELTTPTGAAILAELVRGFGPLPSMQISRIGYGAGTRDLEQRPNLLRIIIGQATRIRRRDDDQVAVIETNLDDISGEQIGFATEQLWKAGALDVFTTPVQMKKGRPGVLLTVLAQPVDRQRLERVLFDETGTLGVRYRQQERSVAMRRIIKVETEFGLVSGKLSTLPNGEIDFSPEYEDCKTLAQQHGLRLNQIVQSAKVAFQRSSSDPDATLDDRQSLKISSSNVESHGHSHSHTHGHSHSHTHAHDHSHTHAHDHPAEQEFDRHDPSDHTMQFGELASDHQMLNSGDNQHKSFPQSRSFHAPEPIRRPYFLDRNSEPNSQDDQPIIGTD